MAVGMLRFLTVAACASLCGGSCEWSYEPGKCEAEISSESAFCGAENASAFVRSAAESLAGRVYVYSNPRLDAALGAIASLDAADGEAEAELHEHQAELLLHQLLIKSPLATSDYARARLFFVPVYTKLAMKHPREVREELELAVRETLESSPRWRSNGGRDHLAVVASGTQRSVLHDTASRFVILRARSRDALSGAVTISSRALERDTRSRRLSSKTHWSFPNSGKERLEKLET